MYSAGACSLEAADPDLTDLSRWSNTELDELLALHDRVELRLKSEEEQRLSAEST